MVSSEEEEVELLKEYQERMPVLKYSFANDNHIVPILQARAEAPAISTSNWYSNFYSCQNNKVNTSKFLPLLK